MTFSRVVHQNLFHFSGTCHHFPVADLLAYAFWGGRDNPIRCGHLAGPFFSCSRSSLYAHARQLSSYALLQCPPGIIQSLLSTTLFSFRGAACESFNA